jgi:SSS family transporter
VNTESHCLLAFKRRRIPSSSETLSLHWLDGAIIAVYLLMLVGIGYYHSRQQKSLKDFFLAGRSVGWLTVGLSLMAALNSGVDYLMVPSSVMQFGLVLLVQNLTWLLLYPYVFFVTLPLYRRLEVYSAYEYLEQRFNVRVRTLTAFIFILWRLGWMATALYVPCLAISAASGGQIPLKPAIVILGSFVTLYTMLGGMKAVVWTDAAQFCIMFGGLAATIAVVLQAAPNGLAGVLQVVSEVGPRAGSSLSQGAGIADQITYFFTVPMTGIGLLIAMTVTRVATYTSDQVMVQRFQTTRNIRDARKGFLITALTDALWMSLLAFVGLALFAYFQANPLPPFIKEQPDRIFPYFMAKIFPPGISGLVIAAILAASLSSVDSAINSLCSVAMIDFYNRLYLRRTVQADDLSAGEQRRQVHVSRLLTIGIGVVGVTLAYNVDRLGSILEISNLIINSFTGPILGIFLLGMFVPGANAKGVFAGGLTGTLVTVYTILWSSGVLNDSVVAGFALRRLWPSGPPVSFLWPSPFGFLTTFLLGCVVSLCTSSPSTERKLTWFAVMKSPLKERGAEA